MDRLVFLTADDLLTIHRRMIEDFGGDPGLRDRGLLESAAGMPRAMFAGEYLHPDVPSMAGAYHYHLCANHPFLDGNKRVAVAAAEVFLRANLWKLDATDDEIVDLTLGIACRSVRKEQVIGFYGERVRAI
jgi:death-on-curing protein